MTTLSVRYFIYFNYIIVGDAGYGLSEVWTKPFSEAELNYEIDPAFLCHNLIYNN